MDGLDNAYLISEGKKCGTRERLNTWAFSILVSGPQLLGLWPNEKANPVGTNASNLLAPKAIILHVSNTACAPRVSLNLLAMFSRLNLNPLGTPLYIFPATKRRLPNRQRCKRAEGKSTTSKRFPN